MNPNFLFLNKGDGTFEDATETSGAAYDEKGQAQSGMGVDAEDVDGDGLPELFVTNFANEYNTLYQNLGNGTFMDATPFFGPGRRHACPGSAGARALADFDNDGWPDNFVANGHVDDNRKLLGQPVDYEEPRCSSGTSTAKRFRLATRDAGPYFDAKHVGRARRSATSTTTATSTSSSTTRTAPRPCSATTPDRRNHWVRLELQGTRSNRDAIGTRQGPTRRPDATASAKAAAASSRRTTRGCWSESGPPRRWIA